MLTLHYVQSRCQCWRRPIRPGEGQGWGEKRIVWQKDGQVDAKHKWLQNENYLCRERRLYGWSHLEETAEFAGLLIALMAKRSRAVPTTWQSGRGIKGGQLQIMIWWWRVCWGRPGPRLHWSLKCLVLERWQISRRLRLLLQPEHWTAPNWWQCKISIESISLLHSELLPKGFFIWSPYSLQAL